MACGVTKAGVVCDNAGTSAHSGQHSGLLTFSFRGFALSSTRVYWSGNDAIPARKNPIVRGTAY